MYKHIIFILVILYFYGKIRDKPKIIYTSFINDNIFNDIVKDKVQIIIIKNSYKECDKLKKNIDNLHNKYKKWKINNNKYFDVNIIQYPLSDYFNNLISLNKYLNQEDIVNKILTNIDNPFDVLKKNLKNYKIINGGDPILNKSLKYQKFIIRKYNSNSIKNKDGLIHIDTDDTGFYKDYKLLSINLYLNDFDGGEIKLWKNIFNYVIVKPNKGDIIIINPNYYHSVMKLENDCNRLSIQSFILIKENIIYIRN